MPRGVGDVVMRKVILLVLLAAILLSACSVKKVEEMERWEDGTCWVTVSDIGARRVKADDYLLCSVGDFVEILGYVYGEDYYRVRCWQ